MRLRESTGASLSGHAAGLPMRDRMALTHRLRASGAALAAALVGVCALIALGVSSMGDYGHELLPALRELVAGHPGAFAEQAPVYGASAIVSLIGTPAA